MRTVCFGLFCFSLLAAASVPPPEKFAVNVDLFLDGAPAGNGRLTTRGLQETTLNAKLSNGLSTDVVMTAASYSNENMKDRIVMNLVISTNNGGQRKVLTHPMIISAPGLATDVIAGNLPTGETLQLKVKAERLQ